MKRLTIISILALVSSKSFAGTPVLGIAIWEFGLYSALGLGILLLLLSFYLLVIAKRLLSELGGMTGKSEFEVELLEESKKLSFWERTFQLKPLTMERHLLIDENYDGISELNNPTPPWFMWLFYSTILFGVIYLLNYHVFKISPLSEQEYKNEVTDAETQTKIFLAAAGASIDENSVKQVTDAKLLANGKEIFTSRCITCHGEFGEGKQGLGPNLTDAYWLHGGSIKDVFHTITEGVQGKGMISWKAQLSPDKIRDVASYVLSLQGSNPPNAKAPEGTPISGTETPKTDSLVKDSTTK